MVIHMEQPITLRKIIKKKKNAKASAVKIGGALIFLIKALPSSPPPGSCHWIDC